MDKLFIIDAVNYLFRSYYAIGPMTNSRGQSTSAVYGFIRSIQKLIKDFSPKYVVCVFDGPDNKQSRLAVYADYKMHRKKAPDDLYSQFDWAYNYCKIANISSLSVPGVEADDTMASIALWAKKQNLETYICTSDKDLCQVVQQDIFVLNAHKDNLIIDEKTVEKLFGVAPNQMLDYLAIVGDASDNIPGIAGFGPKTATELLQKYQTLENIYVHADQLSEKRKLTLFEHKETAELSKQLATLDTQVEFPKDLSSFEVKEPCYETLNQFYQDMNFVTLIKEMPAGQKQPAAPTNYQCIQNPEELQSCIDYLKTFSQIAIDTETTDLNTRKAKLVGIGFCVKSHEAFYIPFNAQMSPSIIIQMISPLFTNPDISFYGHNIKYDYHILYHAGIEITNICFDTLIASYLINPQNRRHNLDYLVLEKFHHKKIPIEELIGKGKNATSMKEVPLDKICHYCSEDVDFTCRLKELLSKDLSQYNLEKVFFDIELPLLFILAKMELHGIYIDREVFKQLSYEFTDIVTKLQADIFETVGKSFNINSPKQLADILYIDLQLPAPKKRSTAAPVLEKLAKMSPVVMQILEYRAMQKLLSTYIDTLPKQINPQTTRIHSTFNQFITATGRLSSQDPNLQNIPIRSKEGLRIREGFIPQKENWSYISADYSQIELRLLAHFSNDPSLIKAFNNHEDIHAYTASLVYQVPIENVTKEMRHIAKAVNFGIIYGQGAFGLSQQLSIPHKEASSFIKTYFERYPNIETFIQSCIQTAEKEERVTTLTGRHRPLSEIHNKNPMIKQAAQRLAVNTPLQGTAADIIKLAMIEIDKKLEQQKLQGYLILQIHDELIFEIPDSEIPIFKELIKNEMENVVSLKVPLTVDIQVGKNWAEC